MKLPAAVSILLGAVLLPGNAFAITGNEFYAQCSGTLTPLASGSYTNSELAKKSMDIGYCIGYVEGYTQAIMIDGLGDKASKPIACLPEKLQNRQMLMVLLKYLENNPQHLHREIATIAEVAYSEAFPCS